MTRAEIRAGARPGELVHISAFLTTFDLVSIEGSTGDLAGEQLAKFSRSHGVQLGDALIAASAIELRDDLATFNTKHFPGVQRVVVPDR